MGKQGELFLVKKSVCMAHKQQRMCSLHFVTLQQGLLYRIFFMCSLVDIVYDLRNWLRGSN